MNKALPQGTVPSPPVPDCWSRIGIWGDGSCPELQRVVHCHNCPVFMVAGQRLFQREPPVEFVTQWTQQLAEPAQAAESAGAAVVVVFRIGEEWLALSASRVVEATEYRSGHRIPHRSNRLLLGLVNIRGQLLLCVSLAELLGTESVEGGNDRLASEREPSTADRREARRLLVVSCDERVWVFPVDEIVGVLRVPETELQPPPSTMPRGRRLSVQTVFHHQGNSVGYLADDSLFQLLEEQIG